MQMALLIVTMAIIAQFVYHVAIFSIVFVDNSQNPLDVPLKQFLCV